MIETWFLNDVRDKIDSHHRLVVTDTRGEGEFLLRHLPRRYNIIRVANAAQEVTSRIKAERDYADRNVVFYTRISQKALASLQEYAKTCGCIVLDDMEAYLKDVLFRNLGIHTHVSAERLLMAAKMGKGKDENWWRGVAEGIINPMDTKSLLIEFLANPTAFASQQDEDVYMQLQQEACRLTNRPYTPQQPEVFAGEVMKCIFDALAHNNISDELLDAYYTMADSNEMTERLKDEIFSYEIPSDVSPLQAHKDHPFAELDKKFFRMLSKAISLHDDLQPYKTYLTERLSSQKARAYKSEWLKHVVTLLNFNVGQPNLLTTLDAFADYYKKEFAGLDTAMRHLYVVWLNEPATIRPVQEYYEIQNKVMLDAWYNLVDGYEPTQQGLLKAFFAGASGRTAVIVCDGLRLEMAEAIAKRKFVNGIHIKRETAWSMLPSVTPNGMSALYGLASPIGDSTAKRHAELNNSVPDVEIMQLMMFNSSVTAQHLVLLYGDIDQIGEKKQLAGLSDIANYEVELYDKITELLRVGFQNVFVTTDHGFVITGLLEEADKMPVPAGATAEERFAVSDNPMDDCGLIKRHDVWTHGQYQYYARTDKPFRTRGAYGYAHGGMTPQECLIPAYQFSQELALNELKVTIGNKQDLSAVAGQFYKIKLCGIGDGSLYESSRKVKLLFYDEAGNNVKESTMLTVVVNATMETEDTLNHSSLKVVVVDALTTAQLDSCIIKKSSSRDLGDLF